MAKKAAGSLKDITTTGPSVEMGIGGFAGALKAYQDGTAEVRGLLLGEVATIFECNFCRSVFRSVELFIEHKRLYCGSKFSLVADEAAQAQTSSHASAKQEKTEEEKVADVQNFISTCLAEYQKHIPTDRVLFEPELADLAQPITSQPAKSARTSKSQASSKPANNTIASAKVKHRDADRRLDGPSSSSSKGGAFLKVQQVKPGMGQAHSRELEVPDFRSRRRVGNAAGTGTPSSSAATSVITKSNKSTQPTDVQETTTLPKAAELLLHRTGTARDAALSWSAANIAASKPPERQPCAAKSVSPLESLQPRKTIETNPDGASGGQKAQALETKQRVSATLTDTLKKQPSTDVASVGTSAVSGSRHAQSPSPHKSQATSAPKATYFGALVNALNKRTQSALSASKPSASEPSVAEPALKRPRGAQGSRDSSSSTETPSKEESHSASKIDVAPVSNAETKNADSVKASGSLNSAKNVSKITPDTSGLDCAKHSANYSLPAALQKPKLDSENAVPASFVSPANNSVTVGSEEASPVKRDLRSGRSSSSQLAQKRISTPFRTIVPSVGGLARGDAGSRRYIDQPEEQNIASSSKPDAINKASAEQQGTPDTAPSTGSDNEKRSESEERSVALPKPTKSQESGPQTDAVASIPVAPNASILQVAQEDINFKAVPVVMSQAERDLLFSRLHGVSETSNECKCGECGEISSSISYGRAHMMSHMRVVRLLCSLCDAGAFFCGDMRKHLMDRHCANLHLAPKGYVLPGDTLPCMDATTADKLTRLVDPTKKGHAFLTPGKIVSTKSHKPYKPDSQIEARILGKTPITRSKSLAPPPVQLPVVPAGAFRFPLKLGKLQQGPSS